MFKLINKIVCHKKKKDQVINVITESDGNIKITYKYHISNLFNNYFTSVEPKMDAKISNINMMFDIPSMLKSIRFNPFTPEKAQMYINQISTSKS